MKRKLAALKTSLLAAVLAVMLAKAVLAAKAALQVWLVKAVQAAARMLRLCNSKTLSACSILNLS